MSDTTQEPTENAGSDTFSDRAFSDFPISSEILRGLQELGYNAPTPVQAKALEPALAGKSLIVRAKTGTGKTTAFCLPMLERMEDGARKPLGIVLAPTRELAQQIAEEAERLAAYRDVSTAVLVGGLAMGPQVTALENGAELIVGTPGRVLDHIRRGHLKLGDIQTCCLDEADEMLSMGFYEDVTKIIDACAENRQLLLFSATISPDTQRLIERYASDAEEIMLSTDGDQVEGIEHVLYETVPGFHKVRALLYLLDLEDPTSAIIFCNTREDTAMVASFLDRQGLDVQLLSGELPQGQRNAVMQKVKKGEVRFLASTDVASRGIDISDLSHVINYSLPQDPAVYLHRIGRTGRIGKKGTAISLVGATDLNTRRALEGQHQIDFNVKVLPSAEMAVQARAERQANQIKDAMGTMAFEAFLPTVRALKERPDGEMLLAAALRAFFQWDRRRKAEMSGSDVPSFSELRREREEERDDDRGGRGKGRGDKRGKGRGDKRDKREGRDSDRDRGSRSASPADDLDALLTAEPKPKKQRSRRKKSDDAGASAPAPKLDDLDALLSAD